MRYPVLNVPTRIKVRRQRSEDNLRFSIKVALWALTAAMLAELAK